MRFGIFFLSVALLLAHRAVTLQGGNLVLLWPAASCMAVGLGYITRLRHRVFGKRHDGSIAPAAVAVLFPYLIYLWTVWHLIRLISREPPHNILVDDVLIGRRLLSSELPAEIRTVVDLTSEFPEPTALRKVQNYISAPMLDAEGPSCASLAELAARIAEAETPIYIHCAQGHGRTGLVAAAVLIVRGISSSSESAIQFVRTVRPSVDLNAKQRQILQRSLQLIRDDRN